jgi:multicomponent Na+:H+ antiporter subunit E
MDSKTMDSKYKTYLAVWAILLTVFWLLLSGFFKTLLLIFGIISVILVLVVIKRMDAIDKDHHCFDMSPKMFGYIGWLFGQIVISSLQVTKAVFSKDISPTIAKLPVDDLPEDKRVVYANSITLTPGTLSVDLDDKEITVHALQKDSITGLKNGDMSSKIKKVWGEANK